MNLSVIQSIPRHKEGDPGGPARGSRLALKICPCGGDRGLWQDRLGLSIETMQLRPRARVLLALLHQGQQHILGRGLQRPPDHRRHVVRPGLEAARADPDPGEDRREPLVREARNPHRPGAVGRDWDKVCDAAVKDNAAALEPAHARSRSGGSLSRGDRGFEPHL
jgi:hypothetical protein